jgi:hypothetical protein
MERKYPHKYPLDFEKQNITEKSIREIISKNKNKLKLKLFNDFLSDNILILQNSVTVAFLMFLSIRSSQF